MQPTQDEKVTFVEPILSNSIVEILWIIIIFEWLRLDSITASIARSAAAIGQAVLSLTISDFKYLIANLVSLLLFLLHFFATKDFSS